MKSLQDILVGIIKGIGKLRSEKEPITLVKFSNEDVSAENEEIAWLSIFQVQEMRQSLVDGMPCSFAR